jgi:hypothetical protein
MSLKHPLPSAAAAGDENNPHSNTVRQMKLNTQLCDIGVSPSR